MSKKKTINVCTGIGLNMFFPEYVTVEILNEKNTIIDKYSHFLSVIEGELPLCDYINNLEAVKLLY